MKDSTFIALCDAVEDQGGELLTETHWPETLIYETKNSKGRKRTEEAESTGCGRETLFDVPYEMYSTDDTVEEGMIKVCAIDDMMDLWPRFAKEL